SIKTGSITNAVRDTKINGTSIKMGELLGIEESAIVASGPVLSEVYSGLMQKMIDDDSEMISIYYGEGVDEVTAGELAQLTENEFPQCDVELHYGGQPVYPYIISVE
ncbi:MAG: DAK2 domain-containing protein, partial [Christensenella sp.]|nr:DAK2 domain-containing protein [Christensenella sp.]